MEPIRPSFFEVTLQIKAEIRIVIPLRSSSINIFPAIDRPASCPSQMKEVKSIKLINGSQVSLGREGRELGPAIDPCDNISHVLSKLICRWKQIAI